VNKINMTQQRSRRRLTNFTMLVSQSNQSNWPTRPPPAYCQITRMLNHVFKVFSGICQQFVEDAIKISNIIGFSTFTR